MTEFIISSDQLERIIEAVEHNTGREINRVVIDGVRAREIVRCRDCANYHDGISQYTGRRYAEPHCLAIGELAYGALFEVSENDYCSWAERREQ